MNAITRAYEAETLDIQKGERAVIARINTGSVDRYNTVIEPRGINLEAYRTNPVVLWEHGNDPSRGRMPIGRGAWVKLEKRSGSLLSKTVFAKDDYSERLFSLYEDGTLRGFSVNVLPYDGASSPPTPEERASRPDLATCDVIYRRTELAEYSAVAVPGNAEALAVAVSRGLWVPDEARAAVMNPGPKRADGDGDTQEPDDDADDEPRSVEKRGDRWHVLSADGSSVADYGTEAEANERAGCVPAEGPERSAPVLPAVAGRPYSSIHDEILGEVRMMRSDILRHVHDFGELLRGRV